MKAINADDVLKILHKYGEYIFVTDEKRYSSMIDEIANLEALEQEPKTGHWIFVDKAHEHAHCSECDYGNVDLLDGRPHNYCPNCGRHMIEPQESEG